VTLPQSIRVPSDAAPVDPRADRLVVDRGFGRGSVGERVADRPHDIVDERTHACGVVRSVGVPDVGEFVVDLRPNAGDEFGVAIRDACARLGSRET